MGFTLQDSSDFEISDSSSMLAPYAAGIRLLQLHGLAIKGDAELKVILFVENRKALNLNGAVSSGDNRARRAGQMNAVEIRSSSLAAVPGDNDLPLVRPYVCARGLNLPAVLLAICRGVPEDQFRADVSSTELRRASKQTSE